MDRYLSFRELDIYKTQYTQIYEMSEIKFSSVNKINVFLSHKHTEDKSLIKAVKGFLNKNGADVYIDWQDENMSKVTNIETARRLKEAIRKSKKFVLLATPDSIESIWIPWELGLADQMKGDSNITLLPIVEDGTSWDRREYYKLYSRIEKLDNEWKVINASLSFTGIKLEEWLRR